mmetsp:Transcript_29409/g.44486  ORF Transcript_29409/g.44486 Transcript_29409/m.44486 type:complete len:138 (-) Transcript_29409:92-505(-)|eukprot:CAMPEP_0170494008 /NCGR_PEP_ID=MMETSP0208-20121228/14388_1 /TAXON_ID=197538 /ORGANISM="Strombidium inclinatum, Strain S3" /LENGTH=137 /DNA_ID=CAMNT_0010769995 /DNA_START=1773 /DNA_END=2186 /DNA_ORIENTATION=+
MLEDSKIFGEVQEQQLPKKLLLQVPETLSTHLEDEGDDREAMDTSQQLNDIRAQLGTMLGQPSSGKVDREEMPPNTRDIGVQTISSVSDGDLDEQKIMDSTAKAEVSRTPKLHFSRADPEALIQQQRSRQGEPNRIR